MSHYICAMLKKDYDKNNGDVEPFADLKFTMSDEYSVLPYNALGSIEYHAGVSGNGETKIYSTKDFEKAVSVLEAARLMNGNDKCILSEKFIQTKEEKYKKTIDFMKRCANAKQDIIIGWW